MGDEYNLRVMNMWVSTVEEDEVERLVKSKSSNSTENG